MSTTKEEAISRLQTEQIDLNNKEQMLKVINL